uniref:GAR domain-containing protein n=1 Tax=Tetranychus urticae TaxID=32264 RepID=T1KVM2_TETUR
MSPASEMKRPTFENSVSLMNINSCENYADDNPSIYSRAYRNFRSNEEYLWAMKEDLAEWLNILYDININADNFIEVLETGVILCRHANNVISKAISSGHKFDSKDCNIIYKGDELRYRANAKPKTFQARDNVSNFIAWCKSLKIHECLLFETDDLVLGKNEKSFILCLLEVARKCTAFGFAAPLIVQMEQEIDRELDQERLGQSRVQMELDPETDEDNLTTLSTSPDSGYMGSLTSNVSTNSDTSTEGSYKTVQPKKDKEIKSESQIITNNLKCLHERILRNHVMVRVGGGWDTLGHYLDRHDPCRCRVGSKSTQNNNTNNTVTNLKSSLLSRNTSNGQQIWVNYNRPYPAEPQYTSFDNLRCDSNSMMYPNLKRRDSIGLTESSCSLNSFSEGSDRQPSRSSQYSDDSTSSSTVGSSISPRSSISSSTGGLHHLSTGQLNSPNTIHFHHLHSKIQANHSITLNCDNNYKQINQRPGFSKTKSGIAKYVGLANYQMPISTINKVNSCTNIRFCHQPSPQSKTIPRKI